MWRWLDGSPWLYTQWGSDAPDNGGGASAAVGENHLLMVSALTSGWAGQWNDASLSDVHDNVVCACMRRGGLWRMHGPHRIIVHWVATGCMRELHAFAFVLRAVGHDSAIMVKHEL